MLINLNWCELRIDPVVFYFYTVNSLPLGHASSVGLAGVITTSSTGTMAAELRQTWPTQPCCHAHCFLNF